MSEEFIKLLDVMDDSEIMRALETLSETERAYLGHRRFLRENKGSLHTLHRPDLNCLRKSMPPLEDLKRLMNLVQGSERWKRARIEGTGASVAGARAGVAHYQSRRFFLLQVAQVIKGFSRPMIFFFCGHNTEPTVRDLTCLFFRKFANVKDCNITELGILVNPHDPTEQVSPDGSIQGGVLEIPPIFASLEAFAKEYGAPLRADQFMAELKSTVNKDPTKGHAELDYLIQLSRQIYTARYQSPELFPLGQHKTHGILAMLHIPFDREKHFNGPDLFQLSVNAGEEFMIRYYIVTRTQEFDSWFESRSKEFLDAYYNQDWTIPNWDVKKPFPIPKHETIAIIGLGKLKNRLTVTYPGEPYGNMCILSGPGRNEPLAQWVFRHNCLLTVEKFKDEYLRHPEILRYMIPDERLAKILNRGGHQSHEEDAEISMPPNGMTVMHIGDPSVPEDDLITCHEFQKYKEMCILHSDCLLRNNSFFKYAYMAKDKLDKLIVIAQFVSGYSDSNKGIRQSFKRFGEYLMDPRPTKDKKKELLDNPITICSSQIYALWVFLPQDFAPHIPTGISDEDIKKWKQNVHLTREEYLDNNERGIHPNLEALINMRRARMNYMKSFQQTNGGNMPHFWPQKPEQFYLFLTHTIDSFKIAVNNRLRLKKIEFLPLYDSCRKDVDYQKDLIKREEQRLLQLNSPSFQPLLYIPPE